MPQKRWPTGSRTKSPPSALHIVTNGKKAGGYAAKGPRLQVFLDKEEHPLLTLVGRGVYLFLRTFHEQKCSNSHKNKQKVKEPKLQKTCLNKGKPQFQARNWGFCSGGPEGIRTLGLRDANAALSQLSHGPVCCGFFKPLNYNSTIDGQCQAAKMPPGVFCALPRAGEGKPPKAPIAATYSPGSPGWPPPPAAPPPGTAGRKRAPRRAPE